MPGNRRLRVSTERGTKCFATVTEAARYFGLNPKLVSHRVHALGWPIKQALELTPRPRQKPHRRTALTVRTPKGVRTFECIKDAATFYGLEPGTVRARLKSSGWTVEQALGLASPPPKPKAHNAKPVRFKANGAIYSYPSVSDAAKAHGLSEFLVFTRMRARGWTIAQALELVPPPEHTKRCYGFIYVITHKATGRKYVGQTMKRVAERWLDHQRSAAEDRDTNRPLATAIRAFGPTAFMVEQLANTHSYHDANRLERHWIAKLKTLWPRGFNITRGGGGLSLGRAVEVNGKRYRSISSAARELRVPSRLVGERLRRGWTVDQAYGLSAEPPTVRSRGRRVTVSTESGPLTFRSMSAAAKHFGIAAETVGQRVSKCGWSIEEALGLIRPKSRWARKRITVTVQGDTRTFASVPQAAAALGVDDKLVYGRLSKGWTIEQSLGLVEREKPRPLGKRCVVRANGISREFHSLSDAAREHGLTLQRVSGRMHRLGWTLEQALGLTPPPKKRPNHASPLHVTKKGRRLEYASIAEAARQHRISAGKVVSRLRNGWTAAQALGIEMPPPRRR
jgi:hypothetical protein